MRKWWSTLNRKRCALFDMLLILSKLGLMTYIYTKKVYLHLFVWASRYPDIKKSALFSALSERLTELHKGKCPNKEVVFSKKCPKNTTFQ